MSRSTDTTRSAAQRPATLHTVVIAAEVLKARGVSVEALLQGTGIRPADLEQPEALITHAQEVTAFGNALSASGDSGVGLDIGDAIPVTAYGCRGTAMLVSPTLEASLRLAFSFPLLAICYFNIALEVPGDEARVVIRDYTYRPDLLVLNSDVCLAAIRREIIGALGGREIAFSRITLAFPTPEHADRYSRLFGCPATFDAADTAMYFPAAELNSPLPLAHPHAYEIARHQCERKEAELARWVPGDIVGRVLELLYENPARKDYDPLGLSLRSLQRRLQLAGTSLSELRATVRRDLAARYLSDSRYSAKKVASRLGFEQAKSLSRLLSG
ncbi:AraC family transcriptional regulator [Paraburkholderia phenazinium]|jgi:AraC-like DNA-binding protein|uniref:AraC-type DNA-binding protein n=1 Tax=Paraburkholderia phenazinium TaxID=60549 RepID=A0A1G7WYZ8_9BURK|nr:AraC family transcriptional regulator [Paraburkholderia phenazinium]SDG77111.1 AraC-type DNA-binding protein [Paraburkholderia phenazinium]